MTKDIWINLPVKDLKKSKTFFTQLGFKFKKGPGDTDVSATLVIGEKELIVMLFERSLFKGFTNHKITDTKLSTEVLFSIDAESKKEVDQMAKKVVKAGGKLFSKPYDCQGWMYGFGFIDLDGHRWNVLYMDMKQMP